MRQATRSVSPALAVGGRCAVGSSQRAAAAADPYEAAVKRAVALLPSRSQRIVRLDIATASRAMRDKGERIEGFVTTGEPPVYSKKPGAARCAKRLSIVLPVCALLLSVSSSAAIAGPAGQGNRPTRHARVLRVQPNDPLTRHNLAHLEARSRTARDVLDRLAVLDGVVFFVRAHPRLVHETRLYGRGRFWVVDGRLFGVLEYQAEPRGSRRALRVLAHELGHALEVALAPRGRDTRTLREVLLAREDAEAETRSALGLETEFARLIGYRVHLELTGRAPADDGLSAAATAARLELPPAVGVFDPTMEEDRR